MPAYGGKLRSLEETERSHFNQQQYNRRRNTVMASKAFAQHPVGNDAF